jgi:universal stress protein A
MFSPKSILVPTDFSDYSDKALEQAIDIAKQYKSKIHLVHVIGVIQQCVVDYCLDAETLSELKDRTIKTAQMMAQDQLAKFPDAKLIDVEINVRQGIPYDEIIKYQIEKKIELIVIASHGKTGLLHYVMGSVTDKVIRTAKIPILLIKS